jgi:hypothetical protein
MKKNITLLILVFSLLAGVATAADDRPVKLELSTQDDDLRDGGEAAFVLRMHDGSEQKTTLTRGERLADWTTRDFMVGPKPPFKWADVKEYGIAARLHPGDGALHQPDKWKVYVILRGVGGTCAGWIPLGEACFGWHNVRFEFDGSGTKYSTLNSKLGPCQNDTQCNGNQFCGTRVARCEPRNRAADRLGCVRLPAPKAACGTGYNCDETRDYCVAIGCEDPDADDDGADRIACGGADCDDNDPNRSPGRTEVCDANGKDEDCDATTFGNRDSDRDGFVDAACYNTGG